ncbi:SRPBCC family protein [Amycolatopsis azurea]|uniref:SRPBCC family protein n=1 Tax=Amycolatopsis azurea TaxID=36819 RepID=UPI00380A4CC2
MSSSGKQSYDVTAESTAPPAAVWALLVNARSWPTWSGVGSLEVGASQELSADGSDGVGAVRAFRTGKTVTKERITALDPERRFSYEGVDVPVMTDYQAAVDLRETPGGGTRIRWHGTYRVGRGKALFFRWYLRRFMQAMATGLAEHAGGPAGRP